jgi:hypothetical protein
MRKTLNLSDGERRTLLRLIEDERHRHDNVEEKWEDEAYRNILDNIEEKLE